jgi:hypothetical protein
MTHPGEKKLVEQARRICYEPADNFERDVGAVLAATSPPAEGVVTALNAWPITWMNGSRIQCA